LFPFGPLTPHAQLMRIDEAALELSPAIDDVEVFLVSVFLRRYVTYCARAKRYARMKGAARLLTKLQNCRA